MYKRQIRAIAMKEGKPVEYIRSEIKKAMLSGLSNPDPEIQARWKQIPCKGDIPTPEEMISYLAQTVDTGIDPFG